METDTIAHLLGPFLPEAAARPDLLAAVRTYQDLLLRWNRRLNLTAVREAENIVTRHFGESFFAAAQWLPADIVATRPKPPMVIDIGSGAGFPGIPLKLYAPTVNLTLVEAHAKKATFLREVVRTLRLKDVTVVSARAETLVEERPSLAVDLVTLRAVEKFDSVLPTAARLVRPGGQFGLLIGSAQASRAAQLLPGWRWGDPLLIPGSNARVLLIGSH